MGKYRMKSTLEGWYESLSEEKLSSISSFSMDMWQAYIHSTPGQVPDAESKIEFVKFCVGKKLSEAVDTIIKAKSRGYINQQCFITEIYFHLGELNLYPERVHN